jgi:hypothetical protein
MPRFLSVAVAIAAASSAACDKDEPPLVGSPAVTADAQPAPRDHLGPGELLEGTEHAFDLVLPRGAHVDVVFPQQVTVSCDAKAEDVANYVRAHVSTGQVKVGAASTMFTRVQLPAHPGRELSIKVEPGPTGSGSRITVRDVTPPPVDPGLTDEQRWRQAGMRGPGQVADPTQLH